MQVNEQQRNLGEMLDSKEDKNYQMGLKTVKIQQWYKESITNLTEVLNSRKKKIVQDRKHDHSSTDSAMKGIYIIIKMQILNLIKIVL